MRMFRVDDVWSGRYERCVSRAEHEADLASLAQEADDPRLGFFGPTSMLWRISRENAVYLTGGRTGILQASHPFVGYALAEHSYAANDRAGRFRRTLLWMSQLIYGDTKTALRASRAVFRRHEGINGLIPETQGPYRKGAEYSATQVGALLWAHLVIWDSSLIAYELIYGELSELELRRYHADVVRFGRLMGVPAEVHPRSWEEVRTLIREWIASGIIQVTPVSRRQAQAMLKPPSVGWLLPAKCFVSLTTHFLEPEIALEVGLESSPQSEQIAAVALKVARNTFPRLPPRARFMPAYLEAQRRLQGEEAPRAEAWLNKAWIGRASFFG